MKAMTMRRRTTVVSILFTLFLALLSSGAARAEGALTNGGNDNGAISSPGKVDTWTFTAASGDSIVLRAGQLTDTNGNFEPWIRLYDPANSLRGQHVADLASEVAVTALTSGTYTVLISDGNLSHAGDSTNDTGTYRLHLAKSPGAFTSGDEGGALGNGATLTGSIDVGDLDMWSFTANAGASLVVRAGETSDAGNFEPWVRLYGPSGTLLGSSAGDLAAEVATTALESGSFTVVIGDGNLSHAGDSYGNTGGYRLHLATSPGAFTTSAGDEGGALVNGAVTPGTIHLGDLDLWSFTASAGDAMVIRAGETSDDGNFEPWVRVYGPSGTLLGSAAGDLAAEVTTTALESGTFLVVVSDGNLSHAGDSYGNTGNYRLHLATTASVFTTSGGDEGGALVNGAVTPGTIHLGDLDLWSFTASAGDAMVIRAGETSDDGNFEPWVRVYGPSGTLLGSAAGDLAAEVTTTALESGTFLVVVSDGNLSHAGDSYGNTGNYRLHLATTASAFTTSGGDEGGALVNGAVTPGTIHLGDLDLWSFTAIPGDAIVVRAGEVSDAGNFEPWVRVYGPSGTLLGSNAGDLAAEVATTALEGGTFLVVVSDGNLSHSGDSYGNTGTYRLHLAQSPGALTTSANDEGGELVNGATQPGTIHAGDLDLWSFTANTGDALVVRVGEVTDAGNFEPWVRVYGPTGTLLGSNAGDVAAEVATTALDSGTFTVVVADANLSHSGDSIGNTGTYRLHLVKSPGSFVVADEGGVRVPAGAYDGTIHTGDLDPWSFCASSGNALVVHVDQVTDNGNFEPWVRLYGPTGTLLGSNAGDTAANIAVTAAATGTFTVVVADGNLSHSGDSLGNTGTYHLTITGSSGCSTSCLAAPAGLVSWWRGEGDAHDAKGGNNGSLQNGASFVSGRVGQGFDLDGIDDFVQFPDSGNLNLTSSFTWDAWVRPDAITGTAVVMGKETSTANRTELQVLAGGVLCGSFDDAVHPGSLTCSTTSAVPAGQFSHVAMVLDDGADEMRLYVNGIRVARRSGVGNPAGNAAAVILGKSPADGQPFGGVVDEPSVYSRALSESEILALFLAGGSGKCAGCSVVDCDDQNVCTTDGCDQGTGQCTHANNQLPCNDGNACTHTDVCSGGTCTGSSPQVCTASDPCHTAGTCNPATGECSNPAAPNGTPCNDNNACTHTDACSGGACTGSNPEVCTASDPCHTAGTCNPSTGACSNPTAPNGTSCNDNNSCTSGESCSAGVCSGGTNVCTGCTSAADCNDNNPCTDDACENPGTPNAACAHTNNTAACNDGNACTQQDACVAGVCLGTNPVVCSATDQCHDPGTCDPGSGACSNPAKPNGTGCDDGSECTTGDSCQAGTCTGGTNTCSAFDLAVVKVKPPKVINLKGESPSVTKRLVVQIQNRGPEAEVVPSLAVLDSLVSVTVESLGGACTAPQATLVQGSPNSVPKTLGSKKKMNVFFEVTFTCANDPLKSTASAGHDDFRYTVTVNRSALGGGADAHPADDVCPHDPLGTDPHPDGSIVDKGCGAPRSGGLFGDEIHTDVVRK